MNREITEEEYAALESQHGAGNVLVLNVGPEQFAFKRYDHGAAMTMLRRRDEGAKDWLEFAARYALLCPTAPAAGKSPGKDSLLSGDERAAMMAERAAFESSLDAAPSNGDKIGQDLAQFEGYQATVKPGESEGGVYHVEIEFPEDAQVAPFALQMRRLTRGEYSSYRDKIGEVEHALQILGTEKDPGIFALSCIDNRRAEVLERWPLLAYGLGRMAIGLGAEARAVSLKKFGGTTAKTSMTSPSAPPLTPP